MSIYGLCEECKQENTGDKWCKECNAKHFQQDFESWTSGNDDIDKLIREAQLSANNCDKVLEWIPYNRFYDIEFIARGGFGTVYKAKWINGRIRNWDNKNKHWNRRNSDMFVALKSLSSNNSQNVTSEFLNEITLHHKIDDRSYIVGFYGITQDPETKNYIMVLNYAKNGSLRNYLDANYDELNWETKIQYLWSIAVGLSRIHKKDLIHRDLHIGNILVFSVTSINGIRITDMGLCNSANYNKVEHTNNSVHGVLPYIAPEILRGQDYTKASDIYSFGIIIYEVISGLPPYHDVSHDENLAVKICQGFRPRFNVKVPQSIVYLIKRCLDANPLNRPIIEEVVKVLFLWWNDFDNPTELTELQSQIKEVDEINNKLSTNSITPPTSLASSYKTHSEAIYTSRLLNFNNLPEPKNSDDHYERCDNTSMELFRITTDETRIL